MTDRERELLTLLKAWPAFALKAGCTGAASCARRIQHDLDASLFGALSLERREEWTHLAGAAIARRKEWAEGRRCELELANHLGNAAQDRSLLTSLSHSAAHVAVIGAVISNAGPVHGIGLDLESAGRSVSDAIRNRLLAPGEPDQPVSNLEFWVIKEAAFKADPHNAERILSDYFIEYFEPKTEQGRVMTRDRTCSIQFEIHKCPEWVLGMAVCVRGVGAEK